MLALQRGPALLELVDLASGMCFVHSTHLGRGSILAFFFTDAPDTDFVVVTTRAVELNQFAARWVRDRNPSGARGLGEKKPFKGGCCACRCTHDSFPWWMLLVQ
jgi:hypothetical protein